MEPGFYGPGRRIEFESKRRTWGVLLLWPRGARSRVPVWNLLTCHHVLLALLLLLLSPPSSLFTTARSVRADRKDVQISRPSSPSSPASPPPGALKLPYSPWVEPLGYTEPFLFPEEACAKDCDAFAPPLTNFTQPPPRYVPSSYTCSLGCLCEFNSTAWKWTYKEFFRCPATDVFEPFFNSTGGKGSCTSDSSVCSATSWICSRECNSVTRGRVGFWPSRYNCSLGCHCNTDGTTEVRECPSGYSFTADGCQRNATCQDAGNPLPPTRYQSSQDFCDVDCLTQTTTKPDGYFRSSLNCGVLCRCSSVNVSRASAWGDCKENNIRPFFGIDNSTGNLYCSALPSVCGEAPPVSDLTMCNFQCASLFKAGWTRSATNCSIGCLCPSNSYEPATVLTCESGYLESVDPISLKPRCTSNVSVCRRPEIPNTGSGSNFRAKPPPTPKPPQGIKPPPGYTPPPGGDGSESNGSSNGGGNGFPIAAVVPWVVVSLVLLLCIGIGLCWWRRQGQRSSSFVQFVPKD